MFVNIAYEYDYDYDIRIWYLLLYSLLFLLKNLKNIVTANSNGEATVEIDEASGVGDIFCGN